MDPYTILGCGMLFFLLKSTVLCWIADIQPPPPPEKALHLGFGGPLTLSPGTEAEGIG